MLEPPLETKRRERGAEAGKCPTRLPKSVKLQVDPGQCRIPWPLDPLADAVERSCAGDERSDGPVVGQQLRAERIVCVVLVGSEGDGLRRLTRERCDRLVRIPMAGSVESLNVSVATGITLFEAVRQRRSKSH